MSMLGRLRPRPRKAGPPVAPRTPAQRIYLALFAAVVGLLVVSVVWVIVTGLIARSRLDDVKHELTALRAAVSHGDLTRAEHLSRDISSQTADAHQLTSGPAWWVGANIPGLGTPLRTGRIVAAQADRIGRNALPGVLGLADQLIATPHQGTTVDLRPLQRASTSLQQASRTVASASRIIDTTAPSWLPLVSGPRRSVVTELRSLSTQVSAADLAVRTALPMLGANRPQRYFLGFMNEAESRALGGLPGAFAILTADHGRIRFTHFGSDDELIGTRARVSTSAEYRSLYGQNDPTGDIRNSDLSPNFPDAARIWAGLWEAKSGQHVDGAIAIDPSAIGYLLQQTGPATLPDGSQVNARNVVTLTQSTQYALYGGTTDRDKRERKTYLVDVAAAVARQALAAPSIRKLATGAERAIHERRLLLWSADATQEKAITGFGLGGVLDAGDRPLSAFFTNNAAGSKLDFYLQRAVTYRRSSCAAGASATATLSLTNEVPSYPLPPYVTTVIGTKPKGAKPGFNRVIVAYYATPGARITSVRLDGSSLLLASAPEGGLTTVRLMLDLPAGATRTLAVTTAEPKATGPVQIVRQAAVRPPTVSVTAPSCD